MQLFKIAALALLCSLFMPLQAQTNGGAQQLTLGAMPEIYPAYTGGEQALKTFIKQHINYQATTATSGTIVIRFMVDTSGNVKNDTVLKGISPGANTECARLVRMLTFTPGSINGHKRDMLMMLPFKFTDGRLSNDRLGPVKLNN